jgi:hypothetical protein
MPLTAAKIAAVLVVLSSDGEYRELMRFAKLKRCGSLRRQKLMPFAQIQSER